MAREWRKPGAKYASRSGTFLLFFCGVGRRYRVSGRGRFACPDEAVSVVTSVSEHARALELNPRNIHTGALSRYYRGIIQTYLYPSPMTADMTCDRLRYRLHDMPRSLSPSVAISFHSLCNPSPPFSPSGNPPSALENASLGRGVIGPPPVTIFSKCKLRPGVFLRLCSTR